MGGGKSVWLNAEAIWQCLRFPGNRGYMCRHHLIDFKRSTLVTFDKVVPRETVLTHRKSDRIIRFVNGSEILYGGLGGEDDLERIKSTEFGFFGIDEATETFAEMFMLLSSRLRWTLPDGSYPQFTGFLASNPEPGWVKDRFVDQRLPDHEFIPALPKDNPHLPKGYDYGLRKDWPEEWTKRYLDGSWDTFSGQIYKEFDRNRHIFGDELEISPYYDHFRVIDHGYTNPTCCIWAALDFDGRILVYDEHYQAGLTIAENAAIIKAKYPKFRGLTLCDPSMTAQHSQRAGKTWSYMDEYRDNKITCIPAQHKDGHMGEGIGINLVKQRFKADSLLIHEKCQNGIREILQYKWRDIKVNTREKSNLPETPVDKDNHFCDTIRYLNMWKPPDAEPPKRPESVSSIGYAIKEHKKQMEMPFFAGWKM
jgi:hypothetical protein